MRAEGRDALVVALLLGAATTAGAAPVGSLSGIVTDRGTGGPVGGAEVYLDGAGPRTVAARDGRFRVEGIAIGEHRLTVAADGYDAATGQVVTVKENRETRVDVALVPFALETVVVATAEDTLAGVEDTISSNRVRPEDIESSAGALNDVNRVIQTMPGVVTESDFAGAMYVRGGDSLETMTFLDRAFLWNPYHLGGFNSLFSPQLIRKVDFYAGGFPARYPNALSAVVDVTYRDGRSGPVSGRVDLSTIDAELLVEGSVTTNSTFIAEARRTYFDLVLGNLNDTAVPSYQDYYARYTLVPRAGVTFSADVLYATDSLELAGVTDDGDLRNGLSIDPEDEGKGHLFFDNEKSIAQVGYTQLLEGGLLIDTGASFIDETTRSDLTGQDPIGFDARSKSLFVFSDLSRNVGSGQLLEWGVQYARFQFEIDSLLGDFRISVPGGRNTGQGSTRKIPIDVSSNPNYLGAYVQHRWEPAGKLELRTGVRTDYWSETGSLTYSPRIDVRYHATERTSLRFAWGIFHQIPSNVLETAPGFGNPDLAQEQSTHYVLGLKRTLGTSSQLRVEAYWKELRDLVVNPDTEEELLRRIPTGTTFTNDGTGRSYGLELFVQKELGDLTGWITYGYAVTRRKNPLNHANPTWYDPLQDQRHTLAVVGSYDVGHKWTVGAKVQASTGKPTTEITGWTLEETGTEPPVPIWVAEYGPVNDARYPGYFKIDLRVEREIHPFGLDGRVYLDVMNATNRKNLYIYSYDSGTPPEAVPSRHDVYSMPILPYAGISLQF